MKRMTKSLALLVVFLTTATAAEAQYFGRNKVQYKNFKFEVLKTEHFDIYFYPEEKAGTELAAKLAERWHARLSQLFGHRLSGRQPLILYASHPDFEQTNVLQGEIGESTGGVTESVRRRIVLPLAGPLADSDHVIGHELVHAFQFDITAAPGGGPVTGAQRLPLWFIEGMAEYFSIGPVDPHTAMWMRDAVRQEKLPAIKDLDRPDYFPYRWGHAFWAYVAGRAGDRIVATLLRDASRDGDIERSIQDVLGVSAADLSKDWHTALRTAYEPWLKTTLVAAAQGTKIAGARGLGGEVNVGPALSPDGTKVAFLSERGLFSIDLYIADASTGKVLHRVSRTAADPHYSSLQFISSAGAWDAQGRRLAFAAVVSGEPALAIYDVERDDIEREIKIEELDEIFNPTWSPDGRAIAFSGMVGGLTDLFVYDLSAARLTRLTTDAFADIQPAWSPDGRRIAFATDRFTSNLAELALGSYRIGLIDPDGSNLREAPGFRGAKNINPQWSPDGSLYFVSDLHGASNVYRADLSSGSVRQVTDMMTGVSGITATSPALAVAARDGRVVFSAYEDGRHELYAMDAEPARGKAVETEAVNVGVLPPLSRSASDVQELLQSPSTGLPPDQQFKEEDYKPRLALDFVGQPTLTAGVDRFGTFAGGGLSFFFSDMLGDHNLATAIQVNTSFSGNSSFRDIGAAVAYTNLKRRWNWGVVAEQLPYLSGGFGQGIAIVNGEQAIVEQSEIFRQTSRDVSLITQYPFSRAHRVEFSGGYRNLLFERELRTTAVSLRTGRVLIDEVTREDLADPVGLGRASAALVYDTSIFGATSPVLGQRYRLEVAPTIGSLQFSEVIADYRKYFMPVDLYTVAGRILHYGRYGADAEDIRLSPVFLGYPNLVRGYDVGSFTASECDLLTSTCPAFDRLIGSRIAVANLEFRFPLLRPFGLRRGVYGPLPVEAAFFADAGVAWDSNDRPEFFRGGNREAVTSAGLALRVNALGFAVLEFDFVRPFQRPDKGWLFQFSLTPGF